MMRTALVLVACVALVGCSSLEYAGIARYEIGPTTDLAGTPTGCCVLSVWNGKQMATVDAQFQHTSPDTYSITLHETDVQAFAGQATAAAAASDAVGAAATAAAAALKTLP